MSMSFRTINKTNIFFNSLIFLKLQNCFRVNYDFILGILSNEKDSKSGNKEHSERKEKRNRRNTDENEWVSKGELINPIKNVSVENSRIEKFLFFHFFFIQFKENIIGREIFDEWILPYEEKFLILSLYYFLYYFVV